MDQQPPTLPEAPTYEDLGIPALLKLEQILNERIGDPYSLQPEELADPKQVLKLAAALGARTILTDVQDTIRILKERAEAT